VLNGPLVSKKEKTNSSIMCNFYAAIMQTYSQWNASRRSSSGRPSVGGIIGRTSRPPSEVGSIRSTMSTGSVEARLNNVETQLASLLQASQQQAALLERQSQLLERLLTTTEPSKTT